MLHYEKDTAENVNGNLLLRSPVMSYFFIQRIGDFFIEEAVDGHPWIHLQDSKQACGDIREMNRGAKIAISI